MKIAVIDNSSDDRHLCIEKISHFFMNQSYPYEIHPFSNGNDFLCSDLKSWDIIFTEITMEEMDGLTLAHKLRKMNIHSLIVFVTSTSEYAVESYDVHAFSYLLKPVDQEKLNDLLELSLEILPPQNYYIEVKEGRIQVRIFIHDILYTDYYNHYIQIHTAHRTIKTYMSFSEFSTLLLKYEQFLSPYRNCIVNMDQVAQICDQGFIMKDQVQVPINRTRKSEIKQAYADYRFKQKQKTPLFTK